MVMLMLNVKLDKEQESRFKEILSIFKNTNQYDIDYLNNNLDLKLKLKEVNESDLVKLAINRFLNDVEELSEEELIISFMEVL